MSDSTLAVHTKRTIEAAARSLTAHFQRPGPTRYDAFPEALGEAVMIASRLSHGCQ